MKFKLNEYAILFHLLSRQQSDNSLPGKILIGSHSEELKEKLGMKGKIGQDQYQRLLEQFAENIKPFGLKIRQNPFNHYWYLTQNQDIQNIFAGNPFSNKTRLAATFTVILSLCLINSGSTDLGTIQKVRKKMDIQGDVEELCQLYLLKQSGNQVKIHENVGYYLDLDQFSQFMETEAYRAGNLKKDP
ncbi:hypothetical protein [Candidatus Lokiarchaeum ossiferum]|uniref:hypothetical protein n=1 Tax=Candidatus Lokiarchaeum ossiferum TaxID=2951803 RepID=UPI00352DCA18